MPIKMDMTADDVDKQIELLKFYPEVVAKHYKPALSRIVLKGESYIRPNIPVGVSGTLSDRFRSKVSGRAIHTLKAQIGWFGDKDAWYGQIVESGAKGHTIEPRGARISKKRAAGGGGATKSLRWMDGDFVFSKRADHPGFSGRGFMAAGFAKLEPIATPELQAAGDAILREMEVK